MNTTRWFVLGTLGALLVVTGVGCGGGSTAGTGSTGTAGTDTSGTAGTTGQGGDTGGGQAGDTGGGQAGTTGGGQAGTMGGGQAGRGGNNNDGGTDARRGGGAGRGGNADGGGNNRDARINLDAILEAIGTFDAGTFEVGNLPACAAGVANGGTCTNGNRCKPTTGNACVCFNKTWTCF